MLNTGKSSSVTARSLLVLLLILCGAAMACSRPSGTDGLETRPTDHSAAQSNARDLNSVTGSMADWVAAVCESPQLPGLVTAGRTGFLMPRASGGIKCTSSRLVAGHNYGILAGYYDSAALADQDLELNRGGLGPYAKGTDPTSGQVIVFAMKNPNPAIALEPLKRFGFSLGQLERRSPSYPASPPNPGGALPNPGVPPTRASEQGRSVAGTVVFLDPALSGGNVENRKVPDGRGGFALCQDKSASTRAGYPEHSFAWDTTLRLRQSLHSLGVRTAMTRGDDNSFGECVDRRAQMANSLHVQPNAVVSLRAYSAATSVNGFAINYSYPPRAGDQVRGLPSLLRSCTTR